MKQINVDDNLTMELSDIDKSIVEIKLNGFINKENAKEFHCKVHEIFNLGNTKIIFDFTNLNSLSLDGITDFTDFMKHLKELHGKMIIVNQNDDVKKVFDLLGFTKFFFFVKNIDEAKTLLNS